MKAGKNSVVKLTYELRNEPEGQVVDSADKENPFAFLFGHGNVLDLFEKNLEGLIAGNQFNFTLSAEEGYGEYDEAAVIQLDKNVFSVDGKVQDDMLFVGNVVPLQDQDGNPFQGRVVAITGDKVTVDLNHPFAGKPLHFSGEIVEVRAAHPVELEHGHVHEHGDHSHH
jgi:FKBP-type peptidyl-prolyl cis-trans isomerase SlyD